MRSIWSCSSCALLLFVALLGREASALHAAREWNDVHRIAKAQVTAHPMRRDEGTCPTDHISCAASLGGGCCPSRYACAAESCYATTAGPSTACGTTGLYACADVNGEAGCCPVGYVCGRGDCYPPEGMAYSTMQCPTGAFLCPSSVNFGCCSSGMGCAPNACYSTAPVTATRTRTITTTDGSETVTTTRTTVVVTTPTPPKGYQDITNGGAAAKFIPDSVPKVAATVPSDEGGGGLSGGAIGGIIGGVVILLVVVVAAAFLIIRRLKKVENIIESKKGSSNGKKSRTPSKAQMEHYGRQLHSDMDDMSVDPLMMAPSTTTHGGHNNNHHNNNHSTSATPQPGGPHDPTRARADSTGVTPSPNMMFNFTDDRSRHASPDSHAGGGGGGGYFDLPQRAAHQQQPMQAARIRGSTDSSGTQHRAGYAYTHWRQQSNASELSADGSDNGFNANVNSPLVNGGNGGGGGGGGVPELHGSGGFVELPSGGPAPSPGYVPGVGGAGGVRSRSGSNTSVGGGGGGGVRGHARRRSDGVAAQGQGQGQWQGGPGGTPPPPGTGLGLTPLDEAAEAEMHGYYGRSDQQMGQTAAGLGEVPWDLSGGFHPQEPHQGRGI